ncbi:Protein of unknown function [Lactobacillus helveticus CIRM-BIA 101]|uniref:Uncharacterized protein n=1 Tax=Lactobacillus helveticus CIRM-BIA 104 TaxID=1226333 RepID=U6FG74_LACHE|nr:Protein of unknown function [Lactobacillus helveticus CIRM-BIA 104]CDI64676.1 Protein of unknown function [Lactobacillus helveticus CIRM-BIA 101]
MKKLDGLERYTWLLGDCYKYYTRRGWQTCH